MRMKRASVRALISVVSRRRERQLNGEDSCRFHSVEEAMWHKRIPGIDSRLGRRQVMRRTLLLGGAAAIAALLTACQSSDLTGGPARFDSDGDEVTVCQSAAPGAEVAFGDVFRIPAEGRITIDELRVAGEGAEVTETYALPPAEDGSVIGSALIPVDADVWQRRVPAQGAVFQGDQVVNLVIVVRRTGDGAASLAPMEVTYTADGQRYSDTSHTRFLIEAKCAGGAGR